MSGEGEIVTREERMQEALDTLREIGVIPRGDSFDIGYGGGSGGGGNDALTDLIANPQQLAERLRLTPAQAQNIRSLIVGGGTGAIHRFLADYFGDEVAAGVGGFISGIIARKMMGR